MSVFSTEIFKRTKMSHDKNTWWKFLHYKYPMDCFYNSWKFHRFKQVLQLSLARIDSLINQSINQSKSLFPQICPLIKRCSAITGVEFMGRHYSHNKKKIHSLFPYVFNVANWRETLKRNSFSRYAIDSTLGSCVAAIYLALIYLFIVKAGEALEFSLCSTFYTWLDSYHLL